MDKRIVALIIAAIAIVGAGVAALLLTGGEEKKTDPDHVIASGDRVSVNYTGSYYGYVGDQNAAVFDTSYRTIAEDGSVFKSCDFSKRSEYEPLEFVVDDGKLLKKFNDAVVGHRVGDTSGSACPPRRGTWPASSPGRSRQGAAPCRGRTTRLRPFSARYTGASSSRRTSR